jgi:hypothetical protein
MYAVAFEADIVSEFLRIPHFDRLKNKHVRVVIEADEATANPKQAIKTLLGSAHKKPFQQIQDPVAWQTAQRDEWA